jgi:hypothetical protein
MDTLFWPQSLQRTVHRQKHTIEVDGTEWIVSWIGANSRFWT